MWLWRFVRDYWRLMRGQPLVNRNHDLSNLQVQTILVDRRDHDALLQAIEHPPKANDALRRLMALGAHSDEITRKRS